MGVALVEGSVVFSGCASGVHVAEVERPAVFDPLVDVLDCVHVFGVNVPDDRTGLELVELDHGVPQIVN
jgi:hypothetical protein